jgi:hypothetical protein
MFLRDSFFFKTKDPSISLIKYYDYKALTSQSIKFCKITVIDTKQNYYNKVLSMICIFH